MSYFRFPFGVNVCGGKTNEYKKKTKKTFSKNFRLSNGFNKLFMEERKISKYNHILLKHTYTYEKQTTKCFVPFSKRQKKASEKCAEKRLWCEWNIHIVCVWDIIVTFHPCIWIRFGVSRLESERKTKVIFHIAYGTGESAAWLVNTKLKRPLEMRWPTHDECERVNSRKKNKWMEKRKSIQTLMMNPNNTWWWRVCVCMCLWHLGRACGWRAKKWREREKRSIRTQHPRLCTKWFPIFAMWNNSMEFREGFSHIQCLWFQLFAKANLHESNRNKVECNSNNDCCLSVYVDIRFFPSCFGEKRKETTW